MNLTSSFSNYHPLAASLESSLGPKVYTRTMVNAYMRLNTMAIYTLKYIYINTSQTYLPRYKQKLNHFFR